MSALFVFIHNIKNNNKKLKKKTLCVISDYSRGVTRRTPVRPCVQINPVLKKITCAKSSKKSDKNIGGSVVGAHTGLLTFST
jgi:hypothetical protein